MPGLLTRRRMLTAGSAAALLPVAARTAAAAPVAGQLVTLLTPIRVYDSRRVGAPLGGAKLASGQTISIAVSAAFPGFALAVFANCTITGTEGSGYLVISGTDLSGARPVPETSNVNWQSTGQTLANLALTTVGGENSIDIRCDGGGRTHVIIDVQGYVPFVG